MYEGWFGAGITGFYSVIVEFCRAKDHIPYRQRRAKIRVTASGRTECVMCAVKSW